MFSNSSGLVRGCVLACDGEPEPGWTGGPFTVVLLHSVQQDQRHMERVLENVLIESREFSG